MFLKLGGYAFLGCIYLIQNNKINEYTNDTVKLFQLFVTDVRGCQERGDVELL